MGLFSSLFGRKKVNEDNVVNSKNEDVRKLVAFESFVNELQKQYRYIAKSEYRDEMLNNKDVIERFLVLEKSNVLDDFCVNNNISVDRVRKIVSLYQNCEKIMDKHNDEYIDKAMKQDKNYLDNILKDVDPNILLDYDQRKAILTDEDYCLVIAGAGAGKTTTVAAKVKYLVEKKNVDPKQILVVSFTNKAVNELRDKLNKELKIDCPVATFHSTGNAILRKQNPERLNIVDSGKLYYVIQNYFNQSIMKNDSLVNNMILFFASYFDAPLEGSELNDFFNKLAKSNFSTMRSELEDFKLEVIDKNTKKQRTIQNEILRSQQEVEIANFLYLNNIEYIYEPVYKYNIQFARKPYTPDFMIKQGDKTAYLEHFGISEDGTNSRYSFDELKFYKQCVNQKILLHREHNTTLLYTFSRYKDRRSLLEHLKEQLEANGFVLKPKSNKEILEKLINNEENRYTRRLINLICRFISNFKTNGYDKDEFRRMYYSTQNARTRLFLDICNDCYLEYERYLKECNAVDFEDMINESARILREVADMKKKLDFKYIIVDEYQDISRQRFDLVDALSKVTSAKIIAVGDDWQSIYAFSGSDITLFTNFEEKVGYAKRLKIENTYRNSQEVIDIAGNFILKNHKQINKELKSPKRIKDPVIIYTFDNSRKKFNDKNRKGANYEMAHALETALEQIIKYNKEEKKPKDSSILLLGRFGFDGYNLEKAGLFEFDKRNNKVKSVKYPFLNITFMTAHASKGLGYDNVVVINGKNETYGFPSKIEDDPVLKLVIKEDRSISNAEERRLFYVAMTRTKNRVFFIAPEQNPSEFLIEIKKDYKNVLLKGHWNEDAPVGDKAIKYCPVCGYPLQYKYKTAYGLRLFICTNEPELCGFMTNNYGAGKLSIMKCDKCRDGYLVTKYSKDGRYFLGCTNYKNDGTGCNNIIWKEEYYRNFNLTDEEAKPVTPIKPKPHVEKPTEKVIKVMKQKNAAIKKANLKIVTYNQDDLNDVVYIIIKCLNELCEIRYFGAGVLIDVLKGKRSEKVEKYHLSKCKEFNKLYLYDKETLHIIVDWLIQKHFIYQSDHRLYPTLHMTNEGYHYDEFMTERLLISLRNSIIKQKKK